LRPARATSTTTRQEPSESTVAGAYDPRATERPGWRRTRRSDRDIDAGQIVRFRVCGEGDAHRDLLVGRRQPGQPRDIEHRGSSRAAAASPSCAHAISFGTWRSLCVDLGLSNGSAVDLMVAMTAAAANGRHHTS
jgi:hypothetical protein